LELKWVFQARSLEKFEMTPLVVDGVIYVVQMPNDVLALDAVTGRKFWQYSHVIEGKVNVCCGRINRGLAILGETLYMGTIDGKLVALDAKTGAVVFSKQIVDPSGGYSLTHAPLVLKDKLILGSAGGEYGIRGFIVAVDPSSGDELWRFNIIPGPGEPGHETWSGDSWKRGGGSVWLTGSYDPDLNLTYWGTGNPAPDWNGDVRLGDNLYTDSVVALNPDTGELKWYFQFTPHDEWDWDSVQLPVLVDREWEGRQRKLMLWANRNGFFYVLDRATGEFLRGKNFVEVTWATGLDENGRPIKIPEASPTREGTRVSPAVQGGTNWYSPAYSAKTGLFYVSSWEYSSVYHKGDPLYTRGNRYVGSLPEGIYPNTMKDSEEQQGRGAIRALSPTTGDMEWEFAMTGISESGILSTAGDVLITGSREGYLLVLDSFTGKNLVAINLGGIAVASPITFTAGGKQRIAISCGNSMFVFGLRE
jgi:alcohol dehydrogenase (cytochrome c)